MKPEFIKSVMNSDREVLVAVKLCFLNGENFELDPCYSTGKFYEDLDRPEKKLDKTPSSPEITQNDIMNGLPYDNYSIKSIVLTHLLCLEHTDRQKIT